MKLLKTQSLNAIIKKLKPEDNIQIYSDGSCRINDSEHSGAYAVIILANNKLVYEHSKAFPKTTNNAMEVQALVLALQISLYIHKQFNIKPPTIFSDSEYAINSLMVWSHAWIKLKQTNKSNYELFEIFHNAFNPDDLSIVKVKHIKAHAGFVGNEIVDKIAAIAGYRFDLNLK